MTGRLRRQVFYRLWKLYTYVGPRLSLPREEKVTIIIPSYSPERVRFVEPNARALLKCDFVERVVVSNHNPATRIRDWVRIDDPRLTLVDQGVRRGPGWAWLVAAEFDPAFLISIDDDLLVMPHQVKDLFLSLLVEPSVPHGRAGSSAGTYHHCPAAPAGEMNVDVLYGIYAVTRTHLKRYCEILQALPADGDVSSETIEYLADDIVISRTGDARPKIHNFGRLIYLPTFDKPGVAIHMEPEFEETRGRVRRALDRLYPSFRASSSMWLTRTILTVLLPETIGVFS